MAVFSDLHSGGSTALFPNRFWQFKHSNHTPTPLQKGLWEHFEKCVQYAETARTDKRLIVVHDGDAIDGNHHGSLQAVTFDKAEQAEVHIDLMDHFLRQAKFDKRRGDRLFYVSGTEAHVGDHEEGIAKDLGAEQTPDGGHVYDFLELEVNGKLVWFLHHGKQRGRGANEGNSLRNWMRDVYFDCQKLHKRPPDLVVSGHVHSPTWNVFIARQEQGFHMMHTVVCPSFQAKTRFAYKVAPTDVNEIGAVFIEITVNGDIRVPKFLLQDSRKEQPVKL